MEILLNNGFPGACLYPMHLSGVCVGYFEYYWDHGHNTYIDATNMRAFINPKEYQIMVWTRYWEASL